MLLTDARGLPLAYTLAPANEPEYEPLLDLHDRLDSEAVIADKGLRGRAYTQDEIPSTVTPLTADTSANRSQRSAANAPRHGHD